MLSTFGKIVFATICLIGISQTFALAQFRQETKLPDLKSAPDVKMRPDDWLRIDKLKHYSVSCILTTTSYYYLKNQINANRNDSATYSASFSFAIGIGKEFKDMGEPGNKFSRKDLVVDALGVLTALAFIKVIE